MSGARRAKYLLSDYNHQQYRNFTLNRDATLRLSKISSVLGIIGASDYDTYTKTIVHESSDAHVKFITKNDEPHAVLWQTRAEKLKEATRWGIVKTHSITGAVISALGRYRITAYQRVAKGLVSNSQAIKLKLLDLYQSRFEALQALESLVNKNNTAADYTRIFEDYIRQLETLKSEFQTSFSKVDQSGINDQTIAQISSDIEADIQRAMLYQSELSNKKDDLRSCNRSRGQDSIMEFVKEQMTRGIYELQGINQDLSYSRKRYFALTRGELNDCIEDALQAINNHQADPRNAVTNAHHGLYSENKDTLLTYDFSDDDLTPSRERDILLAISFIEGWDVLDNGKDKSTPTVSNQQFGAEDLDTITATQWKTHRNWKASLKSIGFFIFNAIRGFFVAQSPWEEESWKNDSFHLIAAELRRHATPNEPLWRKPFKFLKGIYYAMKDIVHGIRDFGVKLRVHMPREILNDWESRKSLTQSLDELFSEVDAEINTIKQIEKSSLDEVLEKSNFTQEPMPSVCTSQLARAEYALTAGEQNDILTALARGANEFGNVFSTIYAKDPVAGLVYTTIYGVCAAAIFLPTFATTVFGSRFVELCTSIGFSVGSSEFTAAVGLSSTAAYGSVIAWDALINGPHGMLVNILYQVAEDPLTSGAYFAAAYAIGYILANGINGHPIPWISDHIKADLGTAPETGYPVFGAKAAFALYEAFSKHRKETYQQLKLSAPDQIKIDEQCQESVQTIDRFRLVHWLSENAAVLPQLEDKQKFQILRHINALFSREEYGSLHQLLYPETHSTIAFQLLSIPLSYIPAVLRVGASFVLSVFAVIMGDSPYPFAPVQRAWTDLAVKSRRDLSRLIVCATHLFYLPYNLISSFFKAIAYTFTMIIGRIAGLFDMKSAHAMHQTFAAMHVASRRVGEVIYPARHTGGLAVGDISTRSNPLSSAARSASRVDTIPAWLPSTSIKRTSGTLICSLILARSFSRRVDALMV